jgi:hypothetical protein
MTSTAKAISIAAMWFFIACIATLIIGSIIYIPAASLMVFMVVLLAAGTISTNAITRAN